MDLEHEQLEPFEPMLHSLYPLVFEYGIAALQKAGDLTNPKDLDSVIKASAGAYRRFIRGCQHGWDLAQRQISRLVVSYQEQLIELRKALRQDRRRRDHKAVGKKEVLIRCIALRQLVLRRLVDTILYHQIQLQNWIVRRFSLEYRIRDVDPVVLRKTTELACDLNQEERLNFHLVSDLTTVVHLGDLVRVTFTSKPPAWSLIELKEGRMNAVLADVIEKAGGSLKEEHLDKIRNQFGAKAALQAKRMEWQQQRHRDVMQVITTDEGIDIMHDTRIKLVPEIVHVEDYEETLRTLCEKARSDGLAVSIFDDALRLIAMNRPTYNSQGKGGVAHLLYHFQFGVKQCELKADQEKELRGMTAIYSFVDLVHMNLYAMWPPPIFLWGMPRDLITDLLFGRVVVFGQLDYSKLFEAARTCQIEMRWARGDELGDLRKVSVVIPGSPRATAVASNYWIDPN